MAEKLSKAEAIHRAELEYAKQLGMQLSLYKMIHSFHDNGMDIELISKATKLSIEELKEILAMDKEDLTYEKLDANNYLRPIN